MFFGTLRTKGGLILTPAKSEAKEATTMKLCTVIAYDNTSITKQLKFLNFHCSVVCGYCSVLCLTVKSIVKNDKIFKFFQIKQNSQG